MGKPKLIYFNARGRGETARLIFAQAGVDYDDERIEKESWPELKKTIPFGQIPALVTSDGSTIVQSIAIARYLAREYNLAGKNSVEMAQADMYVDCLSDVVNKAIPIRYATDEAKKAELKKTFASETLPNFLRHMETAVKANGGKHLVGKDVTWADLAVANTAASLTTMFGSEWEKEAPAMKAFVDGVNNLPKIKKWLETRPKTES